MGFWIADFGLRIEKALKNKEVKDLGIGEFWILAPVK